MTLTPEQVAEGEAKMLSGCRNPFAWLTANAPAIFATLRAQGEEIARLVRSNEHWHIRVTQELELRESRDNELAAAEARVSAAEKRLTRGLMVVNEQAMDDGLWFNAVTAPEAYLQQALRRVHHAIEFDTLTDAARPAQIAPEVAARLESAQETIRRMREALAGIESAMTSRALTPDEILDENSPIRDAIRAILAETAPDTKD